MHARSDGGAAGGSREQASDAWKSQQQPQQLHAWRVFVQCAMLASAAFAATPLILVLDVAERACMAVCQAKHIQLHLASRSSAAAAAAAAAVIQQPDTVGQATSSRHQQDAWPSEAAFAASSSSSSSTHAAWTSNGARSGSSSAVSALPRQQLPGINTSSSNSKAGNSSSSSSRAASSGRPPLLGLLPPWPAMALAVVPGLLLAVLHFRQPAVLQLLLLWAGSLVAQSYGNLLLVMLQRGAKRPAKVRTAESTRRQLPSVVHQEEQHRQQQEGPTGTSLEQENGSSSVPPSSHGWWVPAPSSVRASQTFSSSSRSSSRSGIAMVTLWLYRVLQLVGDAFRVWCLCSAGCLLWQQQGPAAAAAWAGSVAGVQNMSCCIAAAAPPGQLVGAAAAAAVRLHQCIGSCFWLGVDVGLVGACAGVYALAVLGRGGPGLHSML
uniref:Uncharacterized protein n=1 Tax=Tetradesmus obliquus TaxID=3088 RepID=A0A383VBK1_TETOB|eukprot:jgi/Sobl393_1/3651/SZX62323.1